MKKKAVIGFLGSTLDHGFTPKRWRRWRPTVSLCQQEDLYLSRYYLLYQGEFEDLCLKVKEDMESLSHGTEVIPYRVDFDDPWDFEEVYNRLFTFSKEIYFDEDEFEYLFHITTGTHVAQICIFLLTESRRFPGKLIQTSPARESSGTYTVIDLDLSRYDSIARRFDADKSEDISFLKGGIDTANGAFNRLISRIEEVSLRSKDPILLCGPTGSGKSRLAGRMYALKKQRQGLKGPFVEVNCAVLRGETARAELFGHKKGAFTGASADRAGLIKSADGGVLFLDEIGELGRDEQAMLLRAVEEKRFLPLGADTEESSDFQLICGTNLNLKEEVRNGTFREDLYARINLWSFTLPGLKDRREDILPNVLYELEAFEQVDGQRVTFNKEARTLFDEFAASKTALWKANFRDLNGVIRRLCTLAKGGRIDSELVEYEIERLMEEWSDEETDSVTNGGILEEYFSAEEIEKIDLFDRDQLKTVLKVCRKASTLSEAGRTLFNASRLVKKSSNDADRLKKYLAKYALDFDEL
jgi:transcriptional regulatory protein RtcR